MQNPPQVTLSVNGRFHAFEFAEALLDQKALHQLITPYPRWFLKRWHLGGGRVVALPRIEMVRRVREKLAKVLPLENGQFLFNDWFDRAAAQALKKGGDFFVGWSGNSLRSLARARELGQLTILERHSAHIETQQALLWEEFARFGLTFTATHPSMVEKEKAEYQMADWISLPSRFAVNSFVAKGFAPQKLLHHPLATDLSHFSPQGAKAPRFTVLFAGNVSLQKGVAYLLDAFLKWKEPSAELHLVGSVSAEMRGLLSRWIDSRVHFFAPKKGNDFVRALGSASVVCLPSIHDGFNQVALQAMACGTPVICSENTGSEELIVRGETGWVVPAKNTEALVIAFATAFAAQKDLPQMGLNARTVAQKSYSWAAYAERRLAEMRKLKG